MRKKKEALVNFNKSNIINAAKQLFETKGIEQTTMDDIAKQADYSKSTIYVYFKSKDEIYNSIICEYMNLLRNTLEESLKEKDNFEKCYYNICNNIAEFQEKYPIYYESLLGEIYVSAKQIEENSIAVEIYKVGEAINDIISSLLKVGIDENFVRSDIELLPTVFYLWSSISGIISMAGKKKKYFESRFEMNSQEYLKYSFEMLLQAIRNKT